MALAGASAARPFPPAAGARAGSRGAPRASPAISITQAARTNAVATPIQNVVSSVPRKSTTIGRTLNLLLEASISNPLVQCPLGAMPAIEAPEKGRGGREE